MYNLYFVEHELGKGYSFIPTEYGHENKDMVIVEAVNRAGKTIAAFQAKGKRATVEMGGPWEDKFIFNIVGGHGKILARYAVDEQPQAS